MDWEYLNGPNFKVELWRDPALNPVVNRRRNSGLLDDLFAREYLKDLQPYAAAARCGITRSIGAAGRALLRRPRVQAIIVREMDARRIRLQIDADFVLSELMRQLARLMSGLNIDIAEIYEPSGALKSIAEWPAIWRERLVTEITSATSYKRSHDGVVAEESAAWDKDATVTKVKRETTLQIEREIRETLKAIGQHVNVNAFPVPGKQLDVNIVVVTAEKARQITNARKRLERVVGPSGMIPDKEQ